MIDDSLRWEEETITHCRSESRTSLPALVNSFVALNMEEKFHYVNRMEKCNRQRMREDIRSIRSFARSG